MNRLWIGVGLVAVIAGVLYYRKRVKEIEQSHLNPNASLNEQLGSLAGAYPDRYTGQTGGAYYSNDRYTQYKQYLRQGGQTSGKSFNEYLTASEGQSLPST